MYTFNKKSWHYRLAAFGGGMPSWENNLCPYVRLVVRGFLLFSTVTAVVSVLLLANILTIVSMFQGVFLYSEPTWFNFVSTITVILTFCFTFVCVVEYLREHNPLRKVLCSYKDMRPYKEKKKREPSLIVVWLKSLHDKVCPQIDFKD